jgi:hypothetical protein
MSLIDRLIPTEMFIPTAFHAVAASPRRIAKVTVRTNGARILKLAPGH